LTVAFYFGTILVNENEYIMYAHLMYGYLCPCESPKRHLKSVQPFSFIDRHGDHAQSRRVWIARI